MKIKLKTLLNESTNINSEVDEHIDLFMWQLSAKNLQEVNSIFIAPNQERAAIKSKLEAALQEVSEEYRKIMSIFYYFDDKSLGTISEKVLASLLEKTGVFKAGTVAQTGGSGGLSDLEIAGQGVSLKTTQIDTAIGLGSAAGELGVDPADRSLPNKLLSKQIKTSPIKISELPKKFKNRGQEAYDAVDRKVQNIAAKIGNDLFLWAAIKRDSNKKLSGFVFYLLDLNGKKIHSHIMKNGYIQLQSSKSGGVGASWNILDKDSTLFSKGDTSNKYLNLAPQWVKKTFDEASKKLKSEAKSSVASKDASSDLVQGSKISVQVNPAANKPTKFSFDDTSKQVFNAMLSVLTDPVNMQKIVAAIPV